MPSIYHHILWDISTQKSHYFSHSKVEPHNSKRKLCACVQRICSNSHPPKQTKLTNISWTEDHKYQITHELFTRTRLRSRVNQLCADDLFSKEVYHKEASQFYLIYKYPLCVLVCIFVPAPTTSLSVKFDSHRECWTWSTQKPTKEPTFPETWGCMLTMRRPRGILSLLGTLYPIEHSRSLSNPYLYCPMDVKRMCVVRTPRKRKELRVNKWSFSLTLYNTENNKWSIIITGTENPKIRKQEIIISWPVIYVYLLRMLLP